MGYKFYQLNYIVKLIDQIISIQANIYVHCERKHGYKGNIKDVELVGEEMPGQFICSSCGRSCMTFSALLYHHMVHLKLKPFKCRHCCMLTSRKANLYSHCEKNHGHKGTDADIIVDEQEFFKMTQLRYAAILKSCTYYYSCKPICE